MTRKAQKLKHAAHRQHAVTRLLKHWETVTPENYVAGIQWYRRAKDAAREIHPNVLIGAGIIAALSPRQTWDLNKRQAGIVARAALDGLSVCPFVGLTLARDKAWTIAHLVDPTVEEIVVILNGPKITRFFRNIVGDNNAVTVDTWAARAAEGNSMTDEDHIDGHRYARIEQAYQIAAARVGILPREFQAAIWCHVRGSAE